MTGYQELVTKIGDETVISVGILSDTHLYSANASFKKQCSRAFNGCEVIIHAGDLTDISILQAFPGKEIHAVCGNTCNRSVQQVLPREKEILLGGYSIAITHGTGPRHNIEDRVFDRFPTADCIIFGHSHLPICRKIGSTLIINPVSFQATGRYGAGHSYGLLQIDSSGLSASLHTLSG